MIKKLFQNLSEKAEIEFWLSNQKANLQNFLVFLIVLFLPTQLGMHFWPEFSFIRGARIDYLSPTLFFTDILIILLVSSYLNRPILVFLKKAIFKNWQNKKLWTLLGVTIVGILLSRNPHAGFLTLIKVFEFGLLILALAKNIQNNKLRFILPALAIGILYESVLAIAQFQNQGSLGGILYFVGERTFSSSTPGIANASIGGELILRPYGTFPHPNVLAGYLVVSMYVVMRSLSKKIKDNWLYYLINFMGTTALILTLSRVAIIAWIMILGFLFLRKKRLIVVAFFSLCAMFILFPEAVVRFRDTTLSDQSFVDRLGLARASSLMILENPMFGVGIGNFLNNLAEYYKSATQVALIQPVHNIILLLFSQVGLIAGSIISYYFIRLLKKTDRLGKPLLFILLGIGLFDHYFLDIQQGQLLLCLILGIAIAGVIRSNYGTLGDI